MARSVYDRAASALGLQPCHRVECGTPAPTAEDASPRREVPIKTFAQFVRRITRSGRRTPQELSGYLSNLLGESKYRSCGPRFALEQAWEKLAGSLPLPKEGHDFEDWASKNNPTILAFIAARDRGEL